MQNSLLRVRKSKNKDAILFLAIAVVLAAGVLFIVQSQSKKHTDPDRICRIDEDFWQLSEGLREYISLEDPHRFWSCPDPSSDHNLVFDWVLYGEVPNNGTTFLVAEGCSLEDAQGNRIGADESWCSCSTCDCIDRFYSDPHCSLVDRHESREKIWGWTFVVFAVLLGIALVTVVMVYLWKCCCKGKKNGEDRNTAKEENKPAEAPTEVV